LLSSQGLLHFQLGLKLPLKHQMLLSFFVCYINK
jgi:hypothetical protein